MCAFLSLLPWYLILFALVMALISDGQALNVRGLGDDVELCECMGDAEWVHMETM